MPTKENANHKRFIRYRISGLSRTDAYMKAYNIGDEDPEKLKKKRRAAQIHASRLMVTNGDIRKEIARGIDESFAKAQEVFSLDLGEAAEAIVEIRKTGTKEDVVKLRAAEYIVDRNMGKPKTDVNIEGEIKGDITIITAIQRPEEPASGD